MISGSIPSVFNRNFEISSGIVIWIPNSNRRPYTNRNIVENEIEIPELKITGPQYSVKIKFSIFKMFFSQVSNENCKESLPFSDPPQNSTASHILDVLYLDGVDISRENPRGFSKSD